MSRGRSRKIASGDEKFNGIALRIVPDRSIDDGYTVRCRIAASLEKVYLELDLTADDKATNPSKMIAPGRGCV